LKLIKERNEIVGIKTTISELLLQFLTATSLRAQSIVKQIQKHSTFKFSDISNENTQNDAIEFLNILLNSISIESTIIIKSKEENGLQNFLDKNNSFLDILISNSFIKTARCLKCNEVHIGNEHRTILPLEIKEKYSFESGKGTFTECELNLMQLIDDMQESEEISCRCSAVGCYS
jgi:hypothetical protein